MAHIIKLAVLCEYESLVPLRDFLKGQNIEHMLRGVQTWALRAGSKTWSYEESPNVFNHLG